MALPALASPEHSRSLGLYRAGLGRLPQSPGWSVPYRAAPHHVAPPTLTKPEHSCSPNLRLPACHGDLPPGGVLYRKV